MLYAGLDVHKRTTHVTVVDEYGGIVRQEQVNSTAEGLRKALGRYRRPVKAVLEASYNWGLIHDWLDEIADEVVLAHPTKVRAIAEARIKTDKIDSETLAQLLRADLIPQAYAPSKEVRCRKRVLRQRMFLVRLRSMVKNRVRALLAQHAVELPEVSDLFGKAGREWLGSVKLPDADGQLLSEDLELLGFLGERIEATEDLIKELSAGDFAVKWLASIPGIGAFFSVLIRYEVDDIGRFREAKKFASYTGLIPSTYASGDRMMHGRLTKQGNKWLRWAFVEAVMPAITSSPWLRGYYDKIKRRLGSRDACVATARKLAEIVWTVWREKRFYEER